MNSRTLGLCCVALTFAGGRVALAQDAERTLPRPPPRDATPTTLPAAPERQQVSDQTQLLASLKGLTIDESMPGVGPSTRPASEAGLVLAVPALAAREGLVADLNARLGKPLTLADLNAICGRLIDEYRAMGRPVVDAIVPEQDITDGVIRITIVEAKLGAVRVEGVKRAYVAKRIAGQIRLQPGEPIESQTLLDDVDWLNRQSPFRRYQVLFDKGAAPGTTDVVLNASGASYPLRVYGAFENTGSVATGEDRYIAGLNWGDAFGLGLDHQLGYQFTRDDEFRRFQAHGLTYTAPLPWRHLATLSGTWSRTSPDFEDTRIESVGESWQLSGRYEIPLRKKLGSTFDQSVIFGVDFKRSNNNLEFGGKSVYARAADTIQFLAEWRFDQSDDTGATNGRVGVYASPGNLTGNNDDDAYELARAGAEPMYAYVSASLNRQWNLGHGFSLSARSSAQAGSGALLSGEQFGIGGVDTVRGYNERALNSDAGLLGSIEIESPGISPLKYVGVKAIQDDLRGFLFVDAGAGWNFQADDANPSAVHAVSVGPGVRYQLGRYGSVDASYGYRLDDQGVNDGDDGRAHFRVSATFAW